MNNRHDAGAEAAGMCGRHGGRLVVVVGPSGAGKDTVMAAAAAHFRHCDDIIFARRVITRPAEAGGENHQAVTEAQFEHMSRTGAFALSWQAHGFNYGIPVSIHEELARRRVVVVNGSRAALPQFTAIFAGVLDVVAITARTEVLAARLAMRGRENADEIAERLKRAPIIVGLPPDMVEIDNSGALADTLSAFNAFLSGGPEADYPGQSLK